jgi:1,2-phenylacetyl-CoA epoxidase catalytic subunit
VIYHIIKLVPEYKAASKKVYKESCIQKDELKRASIQAYNDKIRRATVAVKDKRMHEGG